MEENEFQKLLKHVREEGLRDVLNYLRQEQIELELKLVKLLIKEDISTDIVKEAIRPENNPVGGEALSATRTEEESK
jgi:hypothetical protein